MGPVTFNEDTLGYVTIFQNVTMCTVMDCVDTGDKIIFVVGKGEASRAIGRKGETVARVRLLLKRDIQVIEFSEKPEEFVANVFHAYDVKKVEIEDRDGVTHATVTVETTKKGRAIGKEGKNLRMARDLIARHHAIESVSVA
jgi:N utilization substance protein A